MKQSYLSTGEVADHLGVSASWLHKLRMLGLGPRYAKLGARCVVYEIADVEAWVQKHKAELDGGSQGTDAIRNRQLRH